ncbi:hypothetical protein [Haloarcula sp. 1CSR25-25]|jgi:hypothetical protein|uniref:hypothetical protein n=1 Tax=Haloarcula sp. 1CSR25-25 TaxID=2862545 RepID=UPI002895ED27|nr:hypothetical protein [Haloarcula sp. 1CSR25-25]MDT3436723.1 hypothetical protein [Haloarcula sp. 1CSR25-25]
MTDTDSPHSFEQLRDQFEDECVLTALDRADRSSEGETLEVLFLDDESGRIYRVLNATRGAPDSGWFVIALAGPNPQDGFERQRRIHDSDTHRVLTIQVKENDQETGARSAEPCSETTE